MIPDFLKTEIEQKLSRQFNSDIRALNAKSVSGGCINNCFQLEITSGNFFLKYNEANRYPGMFEAESRGLKILREAKAVGVPEVVTNGEVNNISYLILEWMEPGKRSKNFWQDFGIKLAKLHRCTAEYFGLDHNNYIGSLPQSNSQHQSWVEFFISERIQPQIKLASDSGAISNSIIRQFDILFSKLNDLIPKEEPSLLHGDLWNGNFLVNQKGEVALIDPAVYFGHREMDLAMTKLFGGFDPDFYEAYHTPFPLEKGFESRVDIHNLYPLLVHVNLFGGGYLQQVNSILKKFI